MILHNPTFLGEHIRMQREDLMRAAEHDRLVSQQPRQPGPGQRLLVSTGVLLVRAGASLQRYAGQQTVHPVRI